MPSHEGPPLYLRRVTISNVRCFERIKIDLTAPHGHRKWAVILGDNGVGKTTLLRCIAMGMCDAASAAGLLREVYGEWNRKVGKDLRKAEIHLEFFTEDGEESASIRTYILPQLSGYSQIEQKIRFGRARKNFPWDRIFACGYGSARRAFGSKDIEDYATIDSVYSLFNYDTPLQNPELVLRRILSRSRKGKEPNRLEASDQRIRKMRPLLDSIAAVLMLKPGSLELTPRGLTIAGPWGSFQPTGGLGDGFQATLAWLTDMLGWAILYDPSQPIEKIRGIILVDEIEQHLHPKWQRKIIKLLSDQFPHLQFIATTHTPMCAIGTTDLDDDECELIKLDRGEGSVEVIENIVPPRHRRADQVLTSMLFDLPTTTDDATVRDIRRYNQLKTASKKLNSAELKEVEKLRRDLTQRFGRSESDLETVVRAEVRAALEKQRRKNIDLIAADMEAVRQLRALAKDA